MSYIRTKKHREKMSKILSGKNHPMYGKHHTKNAKEKMKQAKLKRKEKLGYINSEETRRKIRETITKGENHHNWKGKNASYQAIHIWLGRWFGKPKFCEHCGTTEAKKYEWANVSGEFKRERKDWLRLCTRCHRIYDNTQEKMWIARRKHYDNTQEKAWVTRRVKNDSLKNRQLAVEL